MCYKISHGFKIFLNLIKIINIIKFFFFFNNFYDFIYLNNNIFINYLSR